mmetsp:Transcript_15013/g.41558  ORF Transcript_15013/g.41558 Transcript_15013/m.41558 type:complete len:246 (-) Transcript_15013:1048-1785(-)
MFRLCWMPMCTDPGRSEKKQSQSLTHTQVAVSWSKNFGDVDGHWLPSGALWPSMRDCLEPGTLFRLSTLWFTMAWLQRLLRPCELPSRCALSWQAVSRAWSSQRHLRPPSHCGATTPRDRDRAAAGTSTTCTSNCWRAACAPVVSGCARLSRRLSTLPLSSARGLSWRSPGTRTAAVVFTSAMTAQLFEMPFLKLLAEQMKQYLFKSFWKALNMSWIVCPMMASTWCQPRGSVRRHEPIVVLLTT